MHTYWFDLLFHEPPLDALPGLSMHVAVKGAQERTTPDGSQLCVGHAAVRAAELERYVEGLKDELDKIVAEAKRRDASYHARLRRKHASDPTP
jgi:hypothetical protein